MIKYWLFLCTRRLPMPAIHSGIKKQGGILERNQTLASVSPLPSAVAFSIWRQFRQMSICHRDWGPWPRFWAWCRVKPTCQLFSEKWATSPSFLFSICKWRGNSQDRFANRTNPIRCLVYGWLPVFPLSSVVGSLFASREIPPLVVTDNSAN